MENTYTESIFTLFPKNASISLEWKALNCKALYYMYKKIMVQSRSYLTDHME